MIIRINETENFSGRFYSAFLVTDAGEVSVAPPNESFLYIAALARRVKELLSVKTPENIRIDYPVGMGTHSDVVSRTLDAIGRSRGESLEEAFPTSSREGTQPMQSGKLDIDAPDLEDVSLSELLGLAITKPFNPAGTLSGIKLQVQNVQERITDLIAYSGFIKGINDLVDQLLEDYEARLDEKKAKEVEMNRENSLKKKLTDGEVALIKYWKEHKPELLGQIGVQELLGIVERLAGDELN